MTDLIDLPNSESSTDLNEDNYDDLIVSIEASVGKLSLLIAVCDDVNFRNQIIDRYETELKSETRPYRVTLDRKEPSLRAAIAQLIQSYDYLQKNNKAIITVTGTEELYFLRLGEERSEQEIFFGYLQWTREALREFHYPIVLWVNKQILNSLIKQAPDFWSWRRGVFLFAPINKKTTNYKPYTIEWDSVSLNGKADKYSQDIQQSLRLEDLIETINQAEDISTIKDNSSLWVLCEMVGQIYAERLKNSNSQNYKTEQDLAIQYFQKSIAIRRELNLRTGLDISLANLGSLYEAQGEYEQAKQLYSEGLDILQEQGNYADAINRLKDLARIHHAQGQYEEAQKLYQQALEIYEDGKDADIATYATIINLQASTYHAQGNDTKAEELYIKSLNIRLEKFGESHADVAISLNNLGLLYSEQGRFSEAENRYKQALLIQEKLLGDKNPDIATSLNNLALLYYSQGDFIKAESYLQRSLNIRKKFLGDKHPDIAGSLNNLAGVYKAQGRFIEALPLYKDALAIAITTLGDEHPITQKFRENINKLSEQLSLGKEL